ncbi:MAG: ribonuclease J [Clostridia bacterium]|nr:ribonuclease J [Clostridia bacterium]
MVEAELIDEPKENPRRKSRKRAAEPAKKETKPAAKKAAKKSEPAAEPYRRLTLPKTSAKKRVSKAKETVAAPKPPVRIYFLGGLNEIGKNITLFECGEDMVIIDCGMAFPTEDMLGVDIVIPDFTFVEKNVDRIRGIFITHGHEDHIGSLPYLLKRINVPVYGTALTLGLLEVKLKEHGIAGLAQLNTVKSGEHVKVGCFDMEFIHVNHSISDAVAIALHTPAGTIVHTGDFKIDCTPTEGGMIDLPRFAQLGQEGVLALLADSTNAEREGYTKTEQKVKDTFEMFFARAAEKRIIIATFASNISRVQQIINCAVKFGRKVALSGRSMLNVMTIAAELGYLNVPDGVLIDLDLINRYSPQEIVLITTGSQGEPMSALSRMAFADHRKVEVGHGDCIIISARPIPGNERSVGNVVDELMKRGCEVVYESMYEVHVSGHACQEELKLVQALTKPKYFIPVHGEQKHLRKHAQIALAMGKTEEDIYIGDVGDVLELSEEGMKKVSTVPAGGVMVDGLGVGDVGSIVLRDRRHLGQDGLIVAVCTIDSGSGRVVSGPDVVSRGFVYVRESEALMDEAKTLVCDILEDCANNGITDWGTLKARIKDGLSRLLYEKTRRSPMILPVIMEV